MVELAGSLSQVDARVVGSAASGGDRLAEAIVRTTSNYLASGMAGLVNAFNPAQVVLGGGVVDGWPFLVDAVAERVAVTCQPPAARSAKVSRSMLGKEAVLVGAATLARVSLERPLRQAPHGASGRARGE